MEMLQMLLIAEKNLGAWAKLHSWYTIMQFKQFSLHAAWVTLSILG